MYQTKVKKKVLKLIKSKKKFPSKLLEFNWKYQTNLKY